MRAAPTSLLLQQQQLRSAIVEGVLTPGLLREPRGQAPRIGIYQHAYTARLLAALRDNFGVLPQAMGDEAFDALAHAYIQTHPSCHPSIRWFGHRLADFMAEHEALVPHPAFIDLARMEWALRQAFDAADAPRLTPAEVAARAPDDWAGWVLRFQPSAQLLPMQWQVEPAWRALQQAAADGREAELEAPEPGAHALLVWRPELETRWRSVGDALEAALLPAALAGAPFGELCERAATVCGEAEAAPRAIGLLQQWLGEGLLARG